MGSKQILKLGTLQRSLRAPNTGENSESLQKEKADCGQIQELH